MLDEIKINAPAKLNLFLKILNKRSDGYHNIISGVTFVSLFNLIKVKISKEQKIIYTGPFRPKNGFYKNCIIKKTLDFLQIDKKISLEINIEKNIPVQAGLGSASTDAAALILIIKKMKLINEIDNFSFEFLGADIPSFLYGEDCIVEGLGEKITSRKFPKYFFLLVKPNINFSTKEMYDKSNIIFL